MKHKGMLEFAPCLYASFIIGLVALQMGVLLPDLMDRLDLNYTLAGGVLSAFAVGSLVASPISAFLFSKAGRKISVIIFSAVIPASLLVMEYTSSLSLIYVAVLLIGIGRGVISIYVYSAANDPHNGKPMYVHWLSIIFAVGALMAPVITSVMRGFGADWQQLLNAFVIMTAVVPVWMLIRTGESEGRIQKQSDVENINKSSEKPYYRASGFYVLGMILFCYIGLENCVNGWFVSYFKDMKIMSVSYANSLVSITWMLVIIGRITSAFLSTKMENRKVMLMNCIGTAICFVILISTKQLPVITFSIVGLGFFCAGIYPTAISGSRKILTGSASGMSTLLAIACLGGIVTPQIVGILADKSGLVVAIGFLVINLAAMLAFAVVNYVKRYSES